MISELLQEVRSGASATALHTAPGAAPWFQVACGASGRAAILE